MKGKLNIIGLNSFKFVPLMFKFLCQEPFMYVVIVCAGFVTRFYKGLRFAKTSFTLGMKNVSCKYAIMSKLWYFRCNIPKSSLWHDKNFAELHKIFIVLVKLLKNLIIFN